MESNDSGNEDSDTYDQQTANNFVLVQNTTNQATNSLLNSVQSNINILVNAEENRNDSLQSGSTTRNRIPRQIFLNNNNNNNYHAVNYADNPKKNLWFNSNKM